MRSAVKKSLALIVGIVFALEMSGCATYKVHPEFKERHKSIKSVSLITPQVEAYMLTFQGDKKMLSELIPVMEKTTVEQVEKSFTDKGYAMKKLDLSEETLTKSPDLKTAYFHVTELFKKQLEDIAKNKKKTFTYTLGSDVNTFANLADSDILIFIKEDGIKKSAGEIAKDMAKGLAISAACLLVGAIYIPVPQTAITIVHVAIVDGNDGSVLWYNNNVNTPNWDPSNQKQLAILVKSMLSGFPDSLFKPKEYKGKEKALAIPEKSVSVNEVTPIPTPGVAQ